MKTKVITYTYDPVARVLTIFDGEKAMGCFSGSQAETRFHKLLESDAEIKLTNMNSTASHGQKVRHLRSIWIKLGIDKYRDGILEEYGVISTADLNDQQLDELINHYGQIKQTTVSDKVRSLRSDLLSICNKLGIYVDNGDWGKVNAFFLDKKIAGKLLVHLSEEELLVMRRKLRAILTKRLQERAETIIQQRLN